MYNNLHEVPPVVANILVRGRKHKMEVLTDDYGDYLDRIETDNLEEAGVISTQAKDINYIVLDIDIPAALLKSSTKGHHHLYVNLSKTVTWRQYKRFLKASANIGLLEEGFVKASIERKYSSVRLPWLRK